MVFWPLQIGGGEERLHRGCRGEEPRIEDVHQLVAAGCDEIEARFEGFQIEAHGNSCLAFGVADTSFLGGACRG
jgi:hypothetical protein